MNLHTSYSPHQKLRDPVFLTFVVILFLALSFVNFTCPVITVARKLDICFVISQFYKALGHGYVAANN